MTHIRACLGGFLVVAILGGLFPAAQAEPLPAAGRKGADKGGAFSPAPARLHEVRYRRGGPAIGFHGGGFDRPYVHDWSGSVFLGGGGRFGYRTFGYSNLTVFGAAPWFGYGDPVWGGAYFYNPHWNYVEYGFAPLDPATEWRYGPVARHRFLGLAPDFALGPLAKTPPPLADPFRERVPQTPPAAAWEAAKPVVREIDWEARGKADRFIELGDRYFGEQKFYDALLRYRMAVKAAPDYAMAHLRHGFSLVANRRYEEAAATLTTAFTLEPEILKSGFRLDLLYDDNRLAREAHQEGLAMAALDEPENDDLHFVVGMWLAFSGEVERSRKFFEKARDLRIDDGGRDL